MAKPIAYSRELVGKEALDLVRERGWQALSARAIASRLGSSVGPIYSAFASMEGLQLFLLDEATRIFDERIAKAGSGKSFLDMGIGMATFARDEPLLYRALLENGGSSGRLGKYKAELRARLIANKELAVINPARLEWIFERMWLFALGFASALVHGYAADCTDAGIADLMRSQGAIVIYGEVAGLGDEDGVALRKAWPALLKKMGGISDGS
jgi:AcrR family transcriptional regulator